MNKVNLADWPYFSEAELMQLTEVLNSGNWWRGNGDKVIEFENKFANFHKATYGLGVTNGTHAILLALKALGLKPGDEVIVPSFTFISTILPIMELGGIPIPVDVEPNTFCISPSEIKKAITNKTVGIIPVHMAGNICRMKEICEISKKNNLFIIEDACHAHGAEYNYKKAGSFGDFGVFSFQALKLMTSGEGGCLITSDKDLYNKVQVLHNVGRPLGDTNYQHVNMGSNFRMSEFQAAVLIPQLERISSQNKIRLENGKSLTKSLSSYSEFIPQTIDPLCNLHSYYMYMFYYNAHKLELSREELINELNNRGIPAYRAYSQVNETEVFKRYIAGLGKEYSSLLKNNYPNSQNISNNVVWIHHRILLDKSEDISNVLIELISQKSVIQK
ncbi:DegT/DnrJ/EryC1/StrS family aminotransferase [Cytobacillus kochii]|uniref:DegT/DnrJ/EryC1/StrS family aminotransferase n=1 Tax=Cytobacillus kochii TaxID=859143 RepID=UPI001CD734F8|nr:DegT/DnrJ/EryC1/StrS family aminotransferase [Cytobacillus kochii]MCA1028635.1 DegT/DnrJ/EryC1/StrS family aminotransferase [Cytobacillus kochii]